MSFPVYSDVDLALLLELVRLGRPARPHETYEPVTRHFPRLTSEDLTALRKDGRTRIWTNTIHWAREHLRVHGALEDAGHGTWSLRSHGSPLLHYWLRQRQLADPSDFIASGRTLAEVLGDDWARERRVRKTSVTKKPAPKLPNSPTGSSRAGEERIEVALERDPTQQGTEINLTQLSEREAVRLRQHVLSRLQSMDEYEFENLVARILDALGFRNTVVVGRPGDGGVDVRCELRTRLISATVAVQVKRQQSNVGPKEISYLRDRWGRRVDKLLFITTSDYTAGAREVADDEPIPVTLVNGEQLATVMLEERIGISARVVESFTLDEEFFSV